MCHNTWLLDSFLKDLGILALFLLEGHSFHESLGPEWKTSSPGGLSLFYDSSRSKVISRVHYL